MASPRPDPPAPGTADRTPPALRIVLVASFLFAMAPLCVFPVLDSDTWWHLAAGKLMLGTRSIPRVDPFSYTVAGHPWVTHEWLSQVVGYATVAAGGLDALIALKAAIVLATFGLLAAWAVRRGAPVAPVLLLVLLAASLAADRYVERPQIASLLLFAVFMTVLLDFRDARRDRLLVLPPAMALWANLHSGFVFGLALGAVFLADAVVRRTRVKRIAVVLALCVVAAMLNPNGYRALVYPVTILADPHYRTVTAEYQPIHLRELMASTQVAIFVVLVALGVAAALVGRAVNGRWAPLASFLFGLFAVAALRATRNREIFAVAAVPLLVEPWRGRTRGSARGGIARLLRAAGGPAFAVVAAAILIAAGANGMARGVRVTDRYRRPVGLGMGASVPAAATDFVRRAGLRGNPFHEMRFGGWMIWTLYPDWRVFIDGRQLLYGRAIFDDYVRILRHGPDFPGLVAKYGIEWVMLRNPAVRANPSGDDPYPPLAAALAGDPDWGLVYFDERCLIRVRRSPANEAVLARRELRAIDPLTPTRLAAGVDPVADRDAVLREAGALLAAGSGDPFVRLVAATATAEAGDSTTAVPVFRDLTGAGGGVHRAQCVDALHELGRTLLREQRSAEALPYLRLSRETSPRDVSVMNDLGVALAATGDPRGAREVWERALKADPADTDVQDNLRRLDGTDR